ncbi:MAG TPA: aldose 1-epimerase family protein [Candidatus Dormibacteraeota bacterium]
MSATPSGRQYALVSGDQRAVVVELGAGLRSYRAGRADVVDGYRRNEPSEGGRGQMLLPWPNRIAGGRYAFEGRELQLPVNEPRTGCAIHGLTRSLPWALVDAAGDSITLGLDLKPSGGYPFSLSLAVTYALTSVGLSVRTSATNTGDAPCPFGAGAHPYVRVDDAQPIDGSLLCVPASATLEADARGIPTGVSCPVEGTDFDFRTPRRVGALVLDTAYAELAAGADGVTRISLTAPDGDRAVTVWMDATHRFAMVYSGDTLADTARRRHGIAIEPMTCAPDAFNSGLGLITLQAGETHVSTWGISPTL